MAAFVVILTDDEAKMEEKLKALIEKEKIKKVMLATDGPAGPSNYKIAKDAEVTVLLYAKKTVKVNLAFEKGKLDDKAIEKVLASVKEILPEK